MSPKVSRHRRRKGTETVGPLRKIKTTASVDEEEIVESLDEEKLVESLIDTFPASDPPAWIAVARVGIPKRQTRSHRTRNAKRP
jgi:hypothetical protein